MLQHLVRVHDIEAVVVIGQRIDIGELETRHSVPSAGGLFASGVQWALDRFDPDDLSGRHDRCEVERDRARTAPDIEDAHPRLEDGQQVATGVRSGALPVRSKGRPLVPVGVAVRYHLPPSLQIPCGSPTGRWRAWRQHR